MKRKEYVAPEMEIDIFFIDCRVMTLSGIDEDSGSIDESGDDFYGDGDWEF